MKDWDRKIHLIDIDLLIRLTSEVSYFEREEGEEGFEAVKRSKRRRGGGGGGESTFEEECQATVVLAPNICYLR